MSQTTSEKLLYKTRKWSNGLPQIIGWFLLSVSATTFILVATAQDLSVLNAESSIALVVSVPLLTLIGLVLVTMRITLEMNPQFLKVSFNKWRSGTVNIEDIVDISRTETPGPKSGYGYRLLDYGDIGFLVGGPVVKITLDQEGRYGKHFIVSVKNPDEVVSWFQTIKEINNHNEKFQTDSTAK